MRVLEVETCLFHNTSKGMMDKTVIIDCDKLIFFEDTLFKWGGGGNHLFVRVEE